MLTNDFQPVEVCLLGHAVVKGRGRLVSVGGAPFIEVAIEYGATQFYSLTSAVFSWKLTEKAKDPIWGDANIHALTEARNDLARRLTASEDAGKRDALLLDDAEDAITWALSRIYQPAVGVGGRSEWEHAQATLGKLAARLGSASPVDATDSEDIPF